MITLQIWHLIAALVVALIIGTGLGTGAIAIINAAGNDSGLYSEDSDLLCEELQALTDMLETERLQASLIRDLLEVEYEPHQHLFERTLDRIRSLIASATMRSKRGAAERRIDGMPAIEKEAV